VIGRSLFVILREAGWRTRRISTLAIHNTPDPACTGDGDSLDGSAMVLGYGRLAN
jgi:hypothetical protein